MKKAYAIVVAVMLLTASVLLSPAIAGAEEEIDIVVLANYIVSVENDVLVITFGYKGNYLSLYWDGELDTSRPLVVTIWKGIECIDAGYVD